MCPRPITKIVCMMPRIGSSVGGGKVNAVLRRMNMLADRDATQVVLLSLDHDVAQKIAFAQLQRNGLLDDRILHRSLHEFCLPPDLSLPEELAPSLPDWDQQIAKGGRKQRLSYFAGDVPVMRDTFENTAAGRLTTRQILTDPAREVRLKYLDGTLIEGVARFGDGLTHKTVYVNDKAVCKTRSEHRAFRFVDSAITGKRYHNHALFQKELVARAFPPDCLLFVDGITTVYLAQHIEARKVLFLHANHRDAQGAVLRRPRRMIEQFDGDAIVTATQVHKARLMADLTPACPVEVLPHYADPPLRSVGERAHICTVSRLRLFDKPIHQCIEAFTRIMHLIPGCNYHIYGTGPDEARLAQLIRHANCQDRVILKGHSPNPSQVFASSLMSLAPTMTEGFGLALLESLTQGCPVISYDVDYGPRELVHPGQNGELVAPGDIDAIARAILKIYRAQSAYSAASTRSAAGYSFDAYQKRYHRLIEDILSRKRFFDIAAPDLQAEIRTALRTAPKARKAQLLDLFITLATNRNDLAATYWAFRQKHALFPDHERPLMRCIWLSHRLGQSEDCRQHLATFAARFPESHTAFVRHNPVFADIDRLT